MESTLVHIVFFLKKWGKNFKRKLRALRFFTQLLQKRFYKIILNKINVKNSLPNLYYIESERFMSITKHLRWSFCENS